MLHSRLPRLAGDERGFTLIELLIVILIIGILAAIAIPMFLGQSRKADDAGAKSDARNLVSYMDGCYVPNEDFRKCATKADIEADEVDWGTNPGQVSVVSVSKDSYTVEAVSKADTGGTHNVFTIVRSVASGMDRTCTGDGGCQSGTW